MRIFLPWIERSQSFILVKYLKITSIHPGRISRQTTNLMGLCSGVGEVEGFIFGKENTSICNLLNLLLFSLFSRFCNNQKNVRIALKKHVFDKEITKVNCNGVGERKYSEARAYIREGVLTGFYGILNYVNRGVQLPQI